MAQVRTLDFLPSIFRTETNQQFLSATLDVLVKQPNLKRVEGFIGNKYGYGVEPTDKYVVEPTKTRSDYQLDPSVVFLKPNTQTTQDFINYTGIVQALKNEGGIVDNNDRLFNEQFYSWDSFTTLDKSVNYAQYYWIPFGPDAVQLSTAPVYLTGAYTVTNDSNGFTFADLVGNNPAITMIRGGTYEFVLNGSNPFWIQGIPGVVGQSVNNSRNVLGVTNNGATTGTVVFTVPTSAEVLSYNFPGNNSVDLVSSLPIASINGQTLASIGGNIDGITAVNGKTLMFYDNGDAATQIYFYDISYNSGTDVITLTPGTMIPNLEKILVDSGTVYISKDFYRDSDGLIKEIPVVNNTLFYQNGSDPTSVGIITVVDSNAAVVIDVNVDILGRKTYSSPNGVKFTNGLKVLFGTDVTPATYKDNEYYVEGVGTSIVLLPVTNFETPEPCAENVVTPFGVVKAPYSPEYLTISRNSRDYNAWTRANRWFHQDVLNETIAHNGTVSDATYNPVTRAQRPIIEFEGNLQLFNAGSVSLGSITVVDTTTLDPFTTIVGSSSYAIDGHTLQAGDLVIFTAATDASARANIYVVDFTSGGSINLMPAVGVTVVDAGQVYVLTGDVYGGSSWRFTDIVNSWTQSQQKNLINQAPLFDVFNKNGISLSDITFYPGTNFAGTKLFSYTPGVGANDPVLGFPITYSSVTNIGDISFTINFNSDIFTYSDVDNNPVVEDVSIGYVHYNLVTGGYVERIGWVPAIAPSVQYQIFEFTVTEVTSTFTCDVPANFNSGWNPAQVYRDDQILDTSVYTVTVDTVLGTTTITLATPAVVGEKVTVLVISDQVSKTAYYEIPQNLENNPFNANVTTVGVGDLRNQYRRIYTNAPGIVGQMFGNNNVHDLGNLSGYGDSIIQNSASLVLPGIFLRKTAYKLTDALQYNSREYINYKTLLVDVVSAVDYSIYQSPSDILDDVITQIASIKDSTTSFFWSDMLFSGSPYRVNSYEFNNDVSTAIFSLGRIYDFTSANYYGLGIYITRIVSGNPTYIQLTKGVDYTVSEISPSVTVNYPILSGDVVTVKEFNQTYGSYCPNTPTKVGLYPSFIPGVVLDNTYTTPTYFIRGHDGSYNKLYGTYVNGRLDDFRDIVLLEFEQRVYNNLKVTGEIPLQYDDVFPGEWRTTEYTHEELLNIYAPEFLNWVGQNRVDYKRQVFNNSNKFTYNYNQSVDKLTGTALLQGYWRGIYNWLYDTDHPHDAPWEMLGFTDQPTWWTARYGVAPYTSDNTFMWTELSQGFVWNDGASYIDEARVRPQLLQALPVDSGGNLVSPFVSIVGNYNQLSFNRDWIVGDQGPAESSFLKSSSWPFALMKILSVTKPAQFYNLMVDRDLYKYSAEFDQYLYEDRYHLDPRTVVVYGNGTAKHSYLNWIVDYVNQRGVDGTEAVTSLLSNVDVRLTYNIAGFSAKDYLSFLVEKATPNSKNNSLLIPDDSYTVLLYDNIPEEKITYSSVLIQKTENGYKVYGNSQDKPYFVTVVPKINGRYTNLGYGSVTVTVTDSYYAGSSQVVAYGTEFFSMQAVSEFMKNYGRYLIDQGVLFDNSEAGIAYDWDRMIQEFLYWAQQGWEIGSTISINPDARLLTVNREGLVVQPLTLQQSNFILNQNLLPVQNQDSVVIRENTSFTVKILSEGDTIAYTNLNLASIEHAVVFDNTTVFGDVLYNLTTGLRQTRLLMRAYKTAEWNGFIDAQGFILNEDNIKEWAPNTKYTKNQIVLYKNIYWSAKKLIQPASLFSNEDWEEINYDTIKSGLLPNPSTIAYESQFYYDSNRANLSLDADLLSFSLIGFRPREYMAAADLSDITQINVYKNLIAQKGTTLIANAFKGAQFDQGAIDYKVQENWAIKNGDFGSVLNTNFIEAQLDQHKLTGNPTLIGFTEQNDVTDVQQSVKLRDLINYQRPPTSPYFLPAYTKNYSIEHGLPTAGYVNIDDVKLYEYTYDDLNLDSENISSLYKGNNVWIANHKSSWNVFTPVSLNTQVLSAISGVNEVTFTFSSPHNLVKGDLFVLINFFAALNRYYTVKAVKSLTQVTVNFPQGLLQFNSIEGSGVGFKLVSQRVEQASDLVNSFISGNEFYTRRSWVDYNYPDSEWAVWAAAPVYQPSILPFNTVADLGYSVAYSTALGYVMGDPTINTVLRYYNGVTQRFTGSSNFGSTVIAHDTRVYAAGSNEIIVYDLNETTNQLAVTQTISFFNCEKIAVSTDGQWLYVSQLTTASVYVYHYDSAAELFVYANTLTGPESSGWGTSLACSIDGTKLVVGAPLEDSDSITNSGAAYIYTRSCERFIGDGNNTFFLLNEYVPSNQASVYVNSVLTTNVVVLNDTVIFDTAPANGSVITINYGILTLEKRVQSASPRNGGLFGQSVDTNRYGAEILVGAPFDLSVVANTQGVEGAVYRYTNGGQRYGTITGINPVVNTGDVIFVDGYKVTFTASDVPSTIALQINSQTPTNITVSGDDSAGLLTITVISNTVEVINNIIDLTGLSSVIEGLGIELYTNTQIIRDPNNASVSEFGNSIKMNERDGLVVSGPTATRVNPCEFDYTTDDVENDTIFDNGATMFLDPFQNSGVVYGFDYLPAANESITNPGKYVFGQYFNTTDTDNISLQPRYGYALAFADNTVVVGSPNWYVDGNGMVVSFVPQTTPDYESTQIMTSSWFIDKRPIPAVDINKLQGIQLYNALTNQTLDYLDYIDPIQGKLLGAIQTNIDYISNTDPAKYQTGGNAWGEKQVGSMWLDTNSIRMMDYHQPDVKYNSRYWGKAFPGSSANIYTWVSSSVDPLSYTGAGIPINFSNFTTATILDPSTNRLITVYYFWVLSYNVIPQGKTLSAAVLSSYLLDPISSGISFLAPITTNVVALYNSNESIQDYTSALHVGYSVGNNMDYGHQSWALIRDGVSTDFLAGLPLIPGSSPSGIYLKYLDSFSGLDTQGLEVPDYNLPILVRYGVSIRPRQSMFIDRRLALQNYITYANQLLIQYPIVEMRSLEFLNKVGPYYDTRRYWAYTNWWATGYSNDTKPALEVQTYTDLLRIQQNQLNAGTQGNVFLQEGLIVRVKNGTGGSSETYIWQNSSWVRIGLENGTVQILSTLWTGPGGWDSTTWDAIGDTWDDLIAEETRWIVRWLNEQCYIDEFLIERNRSLMLMFRFIQSESLEQNNYLPWLNKTSLVDVDHRIRSLLPYKKFQRDNQEFLSGYLNEAKPYHVFIKDFVFSYDGIDTYAGDYTDFDLPAQYNGITNTFDSPQMIYSQTFDSNQYLPTNPIWQTAPYSQWASNYGLSFKTNVTVLNSGRAYTEPPKISVYVDTTQYPAPREEAVLVPVMNAGTVTSIIVQNAGSGYVVQPKIIIEPSLINSFSSSGVDPLTNEITITGHDFISGDSVVYSKDPATEAPLGLREGYYYYVRVLDANTIALYYTYQNAVENDKTAAADNLRVSLISAGSGTNYLGITPRLEFSTTAAPVRQMTVTMKFDRVTYRDTSNSWDTQNWDVEAWDYYDDTAASRIIQNYSPTANMPGIDLTQLMTGMEYPNSTFQGPAFSESGNLSILDTELLSPSFTYDTSTNPIYYIVRGAPFTDGVTPDFAYEGPDFSQGSNPTVDVNLIDTPFDYTPPSGPPYYNVQGGQFTDGYGPEELVPGIYTDFLNISVTSDDATLSFRLSVNKYGQQKVYNTNPYTQTALTADFYSTGRIDDVLEVGDASKLVTTSTVTVTTNGSGVATISTGDANQLVLIALSISDAFTFEIVPSSSITNDIILTVASAPNTTFDVTLAFGNMLLLQNEFIGFTSINLVDNTVTGLRRGLNGTITNEFVASGTVVQSVLNRDELSSDYLTQWWYGAPTSPGANTTLATNTSPAAVFLQQTTP